jgi:hypothetical protein
LAQKASQITNYKSHVKGYKPPPLSSVSFLSNPRGHGHRYCVSKLNHQSSEINTCPPSELFIVAVKCIITLDHPLNLLPVPLVLFSLGHPSVDTYSNKRGAMGSVQSNTVIMSRDRSSDVRKCLPPPAVAIHLIHCHALHQHFRNNLKHSNFQEIQGRNENLFLKLRSNIIYALLGGQNVTYSTGRRYYTLQSGPQNVHVFLALYIFISNNFWTQLRGDSLSDRCVIVESTNINA